MSTNLMINMLRKGKTGSEIMSILEALTSTETTVDVAESAFDEPTLDEIQF